MKHSVELIELKNGAKGLFLDVPDATVMYYGLNFRGGDYLSPDGKWDTAHAMEHIVLGANERYRKSTEYSKEFCKNGAFNNASTGTYHLDYYSECADFEAERILDLTCLALEAPLFLNSEYKSEMANIREELKMQRNNHFSELSLKIGEQLGLCDLPYTKRSRQIKNITLKDVVNHYETTHTTKNMRFIFAGQINKRRDLLIKRLEKFDINKGDCRIDLPVETIKSLPKPIVIQDNAVQNIYYRWETVIDHVLSDDEDDSSSALFGALLNTLHSRIFGKAREKGLAYSISYSRYNTGQNSIWWIGGQVMPKNIKPLFSLYKRELTAIARGKFTKQEMNDTKAYALGNFQRSTQTVSQLTYAYETKFFSGDRVERYSKIPERINKLKREDIINAAKQAIDINNQWALGFYGAINKIKPEELKDILSSTYIYNKK